MAIKNIDTNRARLAETVVQRMDLSENGAKIIYKQLLEGYEKSDEYFDYDWERFISSDKEEMNKERGGVVAPTT